MRVAGIDLSTHAVDVVTIDIDTQDIRYFRFLLTGSDAWERTRSVRDSLIGRRHEFWDDVIAIGIEDPRGYNAGVLFRIQGAILACLPTGVLIHPYVPARWRVRSGLKGHALKAEVAQRSIELGGLESWRQDSHDAHLIARAILADLEAQKAA